MQTVVKNATAASMSLAPSCVTWLGWSDDSKIRAAAQSHRTRDRRPVLDNAEDEYASDRLGRSDVHQDMLELIRSGRIQDPIQQRLAGLATASRRVGPTETMHMAVVPELDSQLAFFRTIPHDRLDPLQQKILSLMRAEAADPTKLRQRQARPEARTGSGQKISPLLWTGPAFIARLLIQVSVSPGAQFGSPVQMYTDLNSSIYTAVTTGITTRHLLHFAEVGGLSNSLRNLSADGVAVGQMTVSVMSTASPSLVATMSPFLTPAPSAPGISKKLIRTFALASLVAILVVILSFVVCCYCCCTRANAAKQKAIVLPDETAALQYPPHPLDSSHRGTGAATNSGLQQGWRSAIAHNVHRGVLGMPGGSTAEGAGSGTGTRHLRPSDMVGAVSVADIQWSDSEAGQGGGDRAISADQIELGGNLPMHKIKQRKHQPPLPAGAGAGAAFEIPTGGGNRSPGPISLMTRKNKNKNSNSDMGGGQKRGVAPPQWVPAPLGLIPGTSADSGDCSNGRSGGSGVRATDSGNSSGGLGSSSEGKADSEFHQNRLAQLLGRSNERGRDLPETDLFSAGEDRGGVGGDAVPSSNRLAMSLGL